jgi:hypothetical protein
MRVVLLPEEIYTYLLKHVFEQHLGKGISSGELPIAAEDTPAPTQSADRGLQQVGEGSN